MKILCNINKINKIINLKKKFGRNCIVSKKITDYMSIDKAASAEKKQINLFKKKLSQFPWRRPVFMPPRKSFYPCFFNFGKKANLCI